MDCDRLQEPTLASPARRSLSALRWRGAVLVSACGGVLAGCAWLMPQTDGRATYGRWVLPPCAFKVRTGYPCPTCGLTTSLSAMVRGRVWDAARAHLFGVILALALVTIAAAGALELATGRSMIHRLRPGLWWVWVGVGALVLGWVIKLIVAFTAGDWPVR
jgi:hypothetical protein